MIRIEVPKEYRDGRRYGEASFLEIVCCTKYQFCKESARKVLPTNTHEIFCVKSGEIYVPSIKKRIEKNGILFVRKFCRTELQIKENAEIIHVGFAASLDLPFLEGGEGHAVFEGLAGFSLINDLYRDTCLQRRGIGLKEALLLELLCDMNDCCKATRSEVSLYQKACDWIEKNSVRAITAHDVASAMSCSGAYLNRVIKAISGECLGSVIARYRLECIKNLCDGGDLSACEIADRLGFYSAELLCKFFKYHEGISISAYKRKVVMTSLR